MLGHGPSLSPVRRDSGVYGTRHGERALQWVVAIPRSEGLGGCGTRSMSKNAISSRHYPPLRRTLGYLALGMQRELCHGPSPSPTRRDSVLSGTRNGENARPRAALITFRRDSGVYGARHGERALQWAVTIPRSEGLGGCGTRSMSEKRHLKPSISPTQKDTRVSSTWHGERALPRALPKPDSEEIRGFRR